MAGGGAGLERARRGVALALVVASALFVLVPLARELADAAFPEPDEFQAHLDDWARVLAPIETLVPSGEPIAYACQGDASGKPLPDLDRWFPFFQAVLAPRRIGREVESRYLLAHFEVRPGVPQPAFGDARVLAELAQGLVLVERAGP